MRRTIRGILLFALLACGCGTPEGTKPPADEEALEALVSGDAVPLENAPFEIRISPAGEALPGATAAPVARPDGRVDLSIEIAPRGDETIEDVVAGLVAPSGESAVASNVLVLGTLVPGSPRIETASFHADASSLASPIHLAVAYRQGGELRRTILPLGEPRGVRVARIEVPGDGGSRASGGRVLGPAGARSLGYEVLVASGETVPLDVVLEGTEPRFAVASEVYLVHQGGEDVRARLASTRIEKDRTRTLRFLLDASAARAGLAEFSLVSRYYLTTGVAERAWRLALGIFELEPIADPDGLRFTFRLPSGASGEWTGPGSLAVREAPRDLDDALGWIAERVARDFPAAVAESRLEYRPASDVGTAPEALRRELESVVGSAVGFTLLRTQVRADLFESLGDEPVLVRTLAGQASDLGYLHGPEVLSSALADWRPERGTRDLSAARWPSVPIDLPRERYEPLARRLAALPHSARWGSREAQSLEGVGGIAPEAMPLVLVYDISGVSRRDEAALTLVLSSDSGRTVSVRAQAEGERIEFHLDRLDPGRYRAAVLAGWPDGQVATSKALVVEASAPPAPEADAGDLLDLLSPAERERLARGGRFEKAVAVETEGRFSVAFRRIEIAHGRVFHSEDVSAELVSVRYDPTRAETKVEVRMVSRVAKNWTLSVAPGSVGPARAAEPPARSVQVALSKDAPELVSFTIPGRFGDSFTLLEHSISGSPIAAIASLGAAVGQGEVGPATELSRGKIVAISCALLGISAAIAIPIAIPIHLSVPIKNPVFVAPAPTAPGAPPNTIDLGANIASTTAITLQADGAGNIVQYFGTGGPAISVEVSGRATGIDPGAGLRIPAGTTFAGTAGSQRLVVPAETTVSLDRPGATQVEAFCVELDKPFPARGERLSLAPLDPGDSGVARRIRFLADSGAYPGLDGLSAGDRRAFVQTAIWTALELEGMPDLDPARRNQILESVISQAFTGATLADTGRDLVLDGCLVGVGPGDDGSRRGGPLPTGIEIVPYCKCGGRGCPRAYCRCVGKIGEEPCANVCGHDACGCKPLKKPCPRATMANIDYACRRVVAENCACPCGGSQCLGRSSCGGRRSYDGAYMPCGGQKPQACTCQGEGCRCGELGGLPVRCTPGSVACPRGGAVSVQCPCGFKRCKAGKCPPKLLCPTTDPGKECFTGGTRSEKCSGGTMHDCRLQQEFDAGTQFGWNFVTMGIEAGLGAIPGGGPTSKAALTGFGAATATGSPVPPPWFLAMTNCSGASDIHCSSKSSGCGECSCQTTFDGGPSCGCRGEGAKCPCNLMSRYTRECRCDG
ncbi:MAG: thioester domain-containing protein [Planctomycetes bacterium]|nr:thioester domain-containing protein [Planctomycetota bacterium]